MEKGMASKDNRVVSSPSCDVTALKKCLEENKGDYVKCQSHIEAFRSSCSINKPNASSISAPGSTSASV